VEEVFGEKKRISLEEFQRINEEVTSEMFLSVISFYIKYNYYRSLFCYSHPSLAVRTSTDSRRIMRSL
jgi:hypothetical protein